MKSDNPKTKPADQKSDEVTITINNRSVLIHRGRQSVSEIKNAGDVPLADEIAQELNGALRPLPDDGAVTIKGSERFVSYPKDSASSAE